jgi:hypothetical protein
MGLSSKLCSTHGGTPQNPGEGILEFRRLKPDFLYYSPAMQRRAMDTESITLEEENRPLAVRGRQFSPGATMASFNHEGG